MFNFLEKLDYKEVLKYNTNPLDLLDKLNIGKRTNDEVSPKVLMLTKRFDIESDLLGIQLLKNGIEYIKITEEDIPINLGAEFSIGSNNKFVLQLGKKKINPKEIRIVLFRYFDLKFLKRYRGIYQLYFEQQWYQLFNCLQASLKRCLWINDAQRTFDAENRLNQLQAAKSIGLNIPETSITNIPSTGKLFFKKHPKRTLVKVLHHHEIILRDISHRLPTSMVSSNHVASFDGLRYAPVILQERIPNKKEIRITLVKDKVFPVSITTTNDKNKYSDLHKIEERFLKFESLEIEKSIRKRCVELNKQMGLLVSSIDFVEDKKGQMFFLEVNPIGDWNWLEKHVNSRITDTLSKLILRSLEIRK